MATSAKVKVVTYQSTRGNARVNICPACERRLRAEKVWPHDLHGEECCTVSHGLHYAYCAFCEDFAAALREENCF